MPAISSDYIFKPKYLIYYEKKKRKKNLPRACFQQSSRLWP